MATRSVSLPPAAWLPTSDVASWSSAQLQVKQSSAAVPSPRWLEWLFDDTTDEFIVCHFIVPASFSSSPVLVVYYKCTSATSGTVAFETRLAALSSADATDMDADSFATVNTSTETVPAVAGYIKALSISMTNSDSMNGGDHVVIALNRDVSVDTVVGDVEVIGCDWQYADA